MLIYQAESDTPIVPTTTLVPMALPLSPPSINALSLPRYPGGFDVTLNADQQQDLCSVG